MHSTKISPEFECRGQRSRSTGTKKIKVRHFARESSSRARSSCGIFFRELYSRARSYAGGKISVCGIVYFYCLLSQVNALKILAIIMFNYLLHNDKKNKMHSLSLSQNSSAVQ